MDQHQLAAIAAYIFGQRMMILISFWLNQATVLFVFGCHVFAARAAWVMIGRRGHLLTVFSAALWGAACMRLTVQIRAYNPAVVIEHGLAGELLLWSLLGFGCALGVGHALRQVMLELADLGAGYGSS